MVYAFTEDQMADFLTSLGYAASVVASTFKSRFPILHHCTGKVNGVKSCQPITALNEKQGKQIVCMHIHITKH